MGDLYVLEKVYPVFKLDFKDNSIRMGHNYDKMNEILVAKRRNWKIVDKDILDFLQSEESEGYDLYSPDIVYINQNMA